MGSAGLIDPVTTIVHCGVSLWDDPESLESRSRLLERQADLGWRWEVIWAVSQFGNTAERERERE